MVSGTMTWTTARTALAMSVAARSQFTIREVSQEEYVDWFEQVGKPHLFSEDLPIEQTKMWYNEDWSQVKKILNIAIGPINIVFVL